MIKVPCKDCEKKGCGVYHEKCPEYLRYKEELQKAKEMKKTVDHPFTDKRNKRFKFI